MKTTLINHYGKRPFDFRVLDGKIVYDWINYVDDDGMDAVEVVHPVNEIIKTERVSKFETQVFYA